LLAGQFRGFAIVTMASVKDARNAALLGRCVPMGCPCRRVDLVRRKQTCDMIAIQEM
jgi:hypothetical protein